MVSATFFTMKQVEISKPATLSILDHLTRSEPTELILGCLLGSALLDNSRISTTAPIQITMDGEINYELLENMTFNDQIIGWYLVGKKLVDYLEINQKFKQFVENPICLFLNIDLVQGCDLLPLQAFEQKGCLAMDLKLKQLGGFNLVQDVDYKQALGRELLRLNELLKVVQTQTQLIVDGKTPLPKDKTLVKECEELGELFTVEKFKDAILKHDQDLDLLLKLKQATRTQLLLAKELA